MPSITPNFNFHGQCGEALKLYQQAFGAEITCLLYYSDARREDFDKPLTPEELNCVYHCEMKIGDQRIMMCDNLELPYRPGLSMSLTVTFDTKEEVQRAFAVMQEGCTILVPMRSSTYSSCRVVFTDRFDIRWNLMTEQPDR